MKLKLTRPAIVLDLETTGTSVTSDRIVEISIIKIYPDGLEESKTRRINPTVPIPAGATAVHGISDADVADCPTFAQVAKALYEWIAGCDLIGFNSNRFDIPMLAEEFLRAGIDPHFHDCEMIDVQVLYHKLEPRTLSAGYKFYTGKTLEDAHSAEADARATLEILEAQIERYADTLENSVEALAEHSCYQRQVDYAGTLVYDAEGEVILNIGKYRGQRLKEVLKRDSGYLSWVQKSDFTLDTKLCFRRVYEELNSTATS